MNTLKKVIVFITIASVVGGSFGAGTAKAQLVPVIDSAVIASLEANNGIAAENAAVNNGDLVQTLFEWAQEIAVSLLKKFLIEKIQDLILSAVQGGGNPQFVTSWGDLFEDISGQVQNEFIKELGLESLCEPFRVPLNKIVVDIGYPQIKGGNYCTLQTIIGNTKQAFDKFQRDFESGGFIAFKESLSPNSNFMVTIMRNQNELLKRQSKEQYLAERELEANGGFFDLKDCPGGSGTCLSVTPGSVIKDLASKAAGSNIDFIIQSEKVQGVLTNALTILISDILTKGITKLSGVFDPSKGSEIKQNAIDVDDQNFISYKNNVLGQIDSVVADRNKIKIAVAKDITEIQSYILKLGDYETRIKNKLTAAGKPAAVRCDITNNVGAFRFTVDGSRVDVAALRTDVANELNSAGADLARIQAQEAKNQSEITFLAVKKSEIQGYSNNESGRLALAKTRDQIAASVNVAGTIFERIQAEQDQAARKEKNSKTLNADPDGIATRVTKFGSCTDFYNS